MSSIKFVTFIYLVTKIKSHIFDATNFNKQMPRIFMPYFRCHEFLIRNDTNDTEQSYKLSLPNIQSDMYTPPDINHENFSKLEIDN